MLLKSALKMNLKRLNPGSKLRLLYGVRLNRLLDEKWQAEKKLRNMCIDMDFLGCHGQELDLPHSSERHQAPPERVEEGPGPGGVVLLGEVDQGGEGEDRHAHEEHE